jgi:hypothetical protein
MRAQKARTAGNESLIAHCVRSVIGVSTMLHKVVPCNGAGDYAAKSPNHCEFRPCITSGAISPSCGMERSSVQRLSIDRVTRCR